MPVSPGVITSGQRIQSSVSSADSALSNKAASTSAQTAAPLKNRPARTPIKNSPALSLPFCSSLIVFFRLPPFYLRLGGGQSSLGHGDHLWWVTGEVKKP